MTLIAFPVDFPVLMHSFNFTFYKDAFENEMDEAMRMLERESQEAIISYAKRERLEAWLLELGLDYFAAVSF